MGIRGVHGDAAIAHIKARARRGETAGAARDGRKLGLIVEGGAMRGVISAGALIGLEALGMTRVFDEVYACSAGAINAAYFLAGQAAFGATIYYEDANNLRFLNLLRLRKVVDVDYLFDTIHAVVKRLRTEDVLASRSRFFISVTDARTGEGFLVHAQENKTPLLTLLKASSALPVLYNRTVGVDGRECLDGGCVNRLPVHDAIATGCTDLLVLLTRPPGYVDAGPPWFERWLFQWACARGNARLVDAFLKAHHRANASRDLALGRRPPPTPVNIATICPGDGDPAIARATKNRRRLKAAAVAGALRTLRAFESDHSRIVEVFLPFPE